MNNKKLLIFGFGGHARSVADVALSCGYSELLFVDAHARPGEKFLGFDVLKELPPQLIGSKEWHGVPATGNLGLCKRYCEFIAQMGFHLLTLIAPSARICVGASIGAGSFVANGAHVGPMAQVGLGCIINTGAVVEHEAVVGDYTHVSINSTMAGRSKIGDGSMLGAAAVILDGVSVGSNIIIGAGAVVVNSIKEAGTYVGVPAKIM